MTDEFRGSSENRADARAAQAEQERLLTESKIAAILSIAADAIIALDTDLRVTQFNHGAETTFGYSKAEILGQPLNRLIPERFRLNHDRHVRDFAKSAVAARRMGERQEIFALRKDGSEFPAEASIAQLHLGTERIFLAVLRDVSERKRTEELLARSNAELEARVAERTQALETEIVRREAAQAALLQAQRLEAFGQLTGGIAHDFNNLLTIVLGNLELLEERLAVLEERALLKRAVDAAQMGARLTGRLLSFARRRSLAPAVINLNDLVLGIAELLKRSLGEHITLTTILARALWATRADPSEVENAILNLAINARDAMSKGGKLTIETRNLTERDFADYADYLRAGPRAGDYVCISVTDTGSGMTPEVLARAFEPFFTTKEGTGTGLGLSTIYGFARQSGGDVMIRSVPGVGTTVCLYLPREADRETTGAGEAALTAPLAEDCETILVVEDEPKLRELTMQRLEGLGYVVLEAKDAETAIAALEREPGIQLVFSDIVLGPGLSGLDLGRWVRAHRPEVKVLLTTGYASDAARMEEPGSEFSILHKPYSRLQLAIAVHAELNDQ